MLTFEKPTEATDNVGNMITIPAGAVAVPLFRGEVTLLTITEPDHMKGIVVTVPHNVLKENAKMEYVTSPVQPRQHNQQRLHGLDAIISELADRNEYGLVHDMLFVFARRNKQFNLKSPYVEKIWYTSRSSEYPNFFLVRFDDPSFFIKTPDSENERAVHWEDLRRADPQPMSKSTAEELGIEIKPKEWKPINNRPE